MIKMFSKTCSIFVLLITMSTILPGCQQSVGVRLSEDKTFVQFKPVKGFLPEQRNLRKWDAPVVADLDSDGYPDLLLNDHGFSIKILWNDAGVFSAPYDLIVGDAHGISVADFNEDGDIDIIISRGGGSGSNARNAAIFSITKSREVRRVPDFQVPLATMRGRTVKFTDINNDGAVDLLNFAFPSLDKKGQSENYIYKNEMGQLTLQGSLPRSFRDGQKVLLTDFNNDSIVDLVMYGHQKIKLFQGDQDFTFNDVTNELLNEPIAFVTAVLHLDYDNDGDLDLYLTRGKPFYKGQTFYNPNSEVFSFYSKRGLFDFKLEGVGDILQLENIQSQWPHKGVYLGESGYEYQFPGETHSGRDIRLVNSDVLGFPEKRDKKGMYIGYVGNGDWRLAGNIWSPITAVVRGVPEFQSSRDEKGLQDILLENNNGVFVNSSDKAKLTSVVHTAGGASGDVNNDGFEDIVVVQRGNMVSPIGIQIYLNQQNGTFKKVKNQKVNANDLGAMGLGVQLFDFNLDGNVDILAGNERGKWHLFHNRGLVDAQAILFRIGRSMERQASPLGAKVELNGCDVRQSRIVGSTAAAYSMDYNNLVHFGLGDCRTDLDVEVIWSNGETLKQRVSADQKIVVLGKLYTN